MPRGFFAAYENLRDPRGLDDVWIGLNSDDIEFVADAVGAAAELLREANERGLDVDIDRAAWAKRCVELLDSDHDSIVGFPAKCLGRGCQSGSPAFSSATAN